MCNKDPDIEIFLKYKAIHFEKTGKSRTFFVYDEDCEEFEILGYFSLALQVFKLPEKFSNRKILHLDGFSAKIHGKKITEFPVILIGQIAKNEKYEKNITGNELMQFCLSTLFEGQTKLGGRIILLECKDVPYLLQFYNKFGFQKLERDYKTNDLLQLIKVLQQDEIISMER